MIYNFLKKWEYFLCFSTLCYDKKWNGKFLVYYLHKKENEAVLFSCLEFWVSPFANGGLVSLFSTNPQNLLKQKEEKPLLIDETSRLLGQLWNSMSIVCGVQFLPYENELRISVIENREFFVKSFVLVHWIQCGKKNYAVLNETFFRETDLHFDLLWIS